MLETDFELRRARLTVDGQVGEHWLGRIMMDFETDRARFRDAFLEGRVNDAFSIRAGQFKPPFNGIELESAKSLIAIERGARVRGTSQTSTSTSAMLAATAMSARNRGVMALSRFADGRLRFNAGAWLGAGERGETNDGKELSARLEFEPWAGDEDRLPLVLAAAVVTNGYFGSPRDTLVGVSADTVFVEDASTRPPSRAGSNSAGTQRPGIHVAGNVIGGTTRSSRRSRARVWASRASWECSYGESTCSRARVC